MQETWVRSLGLEDPLEKVKATHSSILAWRIPWTVVHGAAKSWTRLRDFPFSLSRIIYHSVQTLSITIFYWIKNSHRCKGTIIYISLWKQKLFLSHLAQAPCCSVSRHLLFALQEVWNGGRRPPQILALLVRVTPCRSVSRPFCR